MSRAAARAHLPWTFGSTVILLVVVIGLVGGGLALRSGPSSAQSFSQVPAPESQRAVLPPTNAIGPPSGELPRSGRRGATNESDGVLPEGATAFDDTYAGVANIDPELLQALRDAAMEAADDGIELVVNSGWRSPEYEDELFREAVAAYGSLEEASRWVATADTSAHVSGDAVDIGPSDASAWLSDHGAAYGLCQIYDNEPWHYELRQEAVDASCPPRYADPTRDPRLRH